MLAFSLGISAQKHYVVIMKEGFEAPVIRNRVKNADREQQNNGNKPERSESGLKKFLELNSTSYWDTYKLLGYCYVSQGKEKEALELVNTLMEKIHPDSKGL